LKGREYLFYAWRTSLNNLFDKKSIVGRWMAAQTHLA